MYVVLYIYHVRCVLCNKTAAFKKPITLYKTVLHLPVVLIQNSATSTRRISVHILFDIKSASYS